MCLHVESAYLLTHMFVCMCVHTHTHTAGQQRTWHVSTAVHRSACRLWSSKCNVPGMDSVLTASTIAWLLEHGHAELQDGVIHAS